jgi:hypothetical protein
MEYSILRTPEELSRIYDELYEQADQLLKTYNPCEFGGEQGCVRNRLKHNREYCCVGCRYLGAKGCSVKALLCKLWICPELSVLIEGSVFMVKVRELRNEAEKWGLLYFRASKEDVFVIKKNPIAVPVLVAGKLMNLRHG